MNTIQVKTKLGILEGEAKVSSMIFRGVPYAEPPIGDRRFKVPMKKAKWDGVYQALEFGAQCPQADPTSGFYGKEFYTDERYPLPKQSEDCLYLNIWAPKKEGKYPVAFWIHGGAFDHGFGSEMEFDGDKFVSHDVILVTINYRVGVFGFYADQELTKENNFRTTGNYGLLDQIEALKWVYENIEAFHGDKDRITVFGQSAGAISTQALISSPLTKGMIHSAIFQSGAGIDNGLSSTKKLTDAYAISERIKKLCKVKSVAGLRRVKADRLVEILPELYKENQGLAFGPVNDGYVLIEDMNSCAKNGRIHDIPYMIGMTSQDITIEKGMDARKSKFYESCINFSNIRATYSRKPIYMYYFSRQLPSDDAGAFHSSELWYVFGTLDRCWRDMTVRDYRLSESMITAWTNFMKYDDPGVQWKPYTRKQQFIRNFL